LPSRCPATNPARTIPLTAITAFLPMVVFQNRSVRTGTAAMPVVVDAIPFN
jgi:hypothetical protein